MTAGYDLACSTKISLQFPGSSARKASIITSLWVAMSVCISLSTCWPAVSSRAGVFDFVMANAPQCTEEEHPELSVIALDNLARKTANWIL